MTPTQAPSDAPDFFGGGAWCYYPDSLLIRAPLGIDELRGFRFPDLTSAPAGLSARELFTPMPLASKQIFARYKHELDHLVRLQSTSVGLFAHQLDSQLPDQFRWIVEQSSEDRFGRPEPLVTDHDLSDTELFSAATERHSAVRLWHRTDSLRKVLFDRVTSDTQFVSALTLLNWFREGNESVEVEASWPPMPRLALNNTPDTITGRNIFEFFAVLKELDYSAIMAESAGPWQSLMQDSDYNAVTMLWSNAFPKSNLWDIDLRERLDRDVAMFVRHAYPLELYAALDLALWPPLVPTGLHATSARFTWRDIHPGHRFVQLCEWLQSSRVPLTRIGGEDRNDRFRAFQRLACERFCWPTVEELLSVWRADNACKFRGTPRTTNRLMGISLERAGHARLAMTDRLLAAREKAPCDFAVGNISEVDLGAQHLGLVTRGTDGALMIGESPGHSWDIGPAMLRSMILTARYLLRGKLYVGDHPAHFEVEVIANTISVFKQLLARDGDPFERWAREVVDV